MAYRLAFRSSQKLRPELPDDAWFHVARAFPDELCDRIDRWLEARAATRSSPTPPRWPGNTAPGPALSIGANGCFVRGARPRGRHGGERDGAAIVTSEQG